MSSLDDVLNSLAACGVRLAPGIAKENLLEDYSEEELTEPPYERLLGLMGSNVGSFWDPGSYRPASHDVVDIDFECIEDHGSYVYVVESLARITKGDLPLTGIKDFVDVEQEIAWVEFSLDGQTIRWDAKVDGDWLDSNIVDRLFRLLEERKTGRRYAILEGGGQDATFLCPTVEEFERLRRMGVRIDWYFEAFRSDE